MNTFEDYIRNFNYASIGPMKITAKRFLEQIKTNEIVAIDARFTEEYALWHIDFIPNIPINELPDRLDELNKDKTIVVCCPNETRSNIAMHYLLTKGFKAAFLMGGLIGLQQHLLGNQAREFYNA